jgi:hypothetical protein
MLICLSLGVCVAPAHASPDLVPAVALFDRTSLYSKGDRIEIYGADLKQTRSGPILIGESILKIEQPRAVVVWWPRHSNADKATHVRIRLAKANRAEHGTLSLVVKLKDQQAFRFTAKLGDPAPPAQAQPMLNPLASDIAMLLDEADRPQSMIRTGSDFLAELSPEARAQIAKLGADAIEVLALELNDAAGNDVSFSEVSFVRPRSAAGKRVTLSGSLLAPAQRAGSVVKLLGTDGKVRTSPVSASNSFVFRNVQVGQPVSIRFNLDDQDYFADQGRWLVPEDNMTLAIHVEPAYVNDDGHMPDPSKREFHYFASADNPGASIYSPHARLHWNGAAAIQEFDSITFTNNWGYVDRDRFADNSDGCYRVVHLGSSHTVSLQVPVAQKYNLLMEEELGLKLNRCVEVVSAGRDNGDIGANYPTIRNYAVRFKPDIVMIEIQPALLMQLDPALLRQMLGWDPENAVIGRIVYGADGRMKFQPPNLSNYLLYVTQPDPREYVPGVGFYDTLKVEWNRLPDPAQRAYRYLVDIVKFYRETFPGVRFVLHTGTEQAQCGPSSSCTDRVVTATDGTTFKVGLDTYLKNFKRVCRDGALECISLPHYRFETDTRLPLIFTLDGHYNIRGHQWLARELVARIFDGFAVAKR